MIFKRKTIQDFKPDVNPSTFSKTVRRSRQQKQEILKWFLYAMTFLAALVVQDVVMSQLRLFGATTDLPVCVLLLIAMLEGTRVGSLFLLVSSTVYYFTGSSPGPYSVGILTILGTITVMLRQMYLHRSKGSMVACTGIALVTYEIGVFIAGLATGRTILPRFPVFVFTGLYSALALIPLYSVLERISIIGGDTWKE